MIKTIQYSPTKQITIEWDDKGRVVSSEWKDTTPADLSTGGKRLIELRGAYGRKGKVGGSSKSPTAGVIKIAKKSASGSTAYLEDMRTISFPHPFESGAYVFTDENGGVAASVQVKEGWEIDGKQSIYFNVFVPPENRKKGYGGMALEALKGLADKHGVILYGEVSAFGTKKGMTDKQLMKWYKSQGFIEGNVPGRYGNVYYYPKTADLSSGKRVTELRGKFGRKGKVGGSSSTPTYADSYIPDPVDIDNYPVGWKPVDVAPGLGVWKITKNADRLLDLQDGSFAVAIRGPFKGEVFAYESSGDLQHEEVLNVIHKTADIDDFVRYQINGYNAGYYLTPGKNIPVTSTLFAGEVDNPEKALKNIYSASDKLVSYGMYKDAPLIIHESLQSTILWVNTTFGEFSMTGRLVELRGAYGRPGKVGGSSKTPTSEKPIIEEYKSPQGIYPANDLFVDRYVIENGDPTLMDTKFRNGFMDYSEILEKFDQHRFSEEDFNKPTMWRSLSGYEMDSILQTGQIQSTNAMSFQDQKGMTFYDSGMSRMYAEDNFKPRVIAHIQEVHPDFPNPTLGSSAYIIEVRKPAGVKWNAQKEFYTTSPLSASEITSIVQVRPSYQDIDGSFGAFGYRDVTEDFLPRLRKDSNLTAFMKRKFAELRGAYGRPGKVGGSSSVAQSPVTGGTNGAAQSLDYYRQKLHSTYRKERTPDREKGEDWETPSEQRTGTAFTYRQPYGQQDPDDAILLALNKWEVDFQMYGGGRAKAMGYEFHPDETFDEYLVRCEQAMKDELSDANTFIRFTPKGFEEAAEDSEVVNTFDPRKKTTKTGAKFKENKISYKSYKESRIDGESVSLGIDPSALPEDRPVYGYLSKHANGRLVNSPFNESQLDAKRDDPWLSQYGDVAVKLKPSRRPNTTFTSSDSLDGNGRMRSSKLDTPSFFSNIFATNNIDVLADVNKGVDDGLYWEAQIYGGVGLGDIEHIYTRTPLSDKTISILDERGIPWTLVE
jgi:hypothetical protein